MQKHRVGAVRVCLLLLALFGCAEVGQLQSKIAGNDSGTPTFSIFYDQGDYLKDLVAKKDFARAATFYQDQQPYFQEHGEKLKDVVVAAAEGLNAQWRHNLEDDVKACSGIQWPAPRSDWAPIKGRLSHCAEDIGNYKAIKLVSGDRALEIAGTLDALVGPLQAKISADAAPLLASEDIYSGRNFFADYPVEISLYPEFVRKLKAQFNAASPSAADKLLVAARAYKGQDDTITQEFVEEFSAILASRKGKSSLADVVELYNSGAAAGIAPAVMPVSVAIYVDNAEQAPFSLAVERDLPFDWRDVSEDAIRSGHVDADYVVVVGPSRPRVDRRVGNYAKEPSRYLQGYQTVPNPAYTSALLDLQRAQNSVANARALQIQAASAVICNQYGCQPNGVAQLAASIVMIAAARQFNNAQNEVRSTPPTLQEPVYADYAYDTSVITSEKETGWELAVEASGAKVPMLGVSRYDDKKEFTVAYNVNPNDQEGVQSRYSTEADVDSWEKADVDLKFSEMLSSTQPRAISGGWNAVFASLASAPPESPPARGVQMASAPATPHPLSTDKRFASVVVIRTASAFGAGFFVTGDDVVTNEHVVEGQEFVRVKTYGGEDLNGKVEAEDKRRDLALIHVSGSGAPVRFAKGEIEVGSSVDVIGHPKGLQFSLTRGVVSQIRAMPPVEGVGSGLVSYIQIDAPISPGNSGGPVYENGRVIGMAEFKLAARDAENLNFAIDRDEILGFLREQGISP